MTGLVKAGQAHGWLNAADRQDITIALVQVGRPLFDVLKRL